MLRIFSAALGPAGGRQEQLRTAEGGEADAEKKQTGGAELRGTETATEARPTEPATLVYVQTHSVPSRACPGSQPSHFLPVAPGRHVQSPVTGSQGTGREP